MVDVALKNIVKIYDGDVLAVDDVSLDINQGEFVTLVGPSGSGKSTLLRMIAGISTVTDGRILFDDRNVADDPPQERNVAMVFQNYALYPNMTVRENMGFGLKMRGTPEAEREEAVTETAGRLQIEELLDRSVQQLSGGQQQRVALGRSIIRDPEVFLLDEPLANLDAKLRTEMRARLVELQRDLGVTTVYVTHNQIEALTMSDRVAVMNKGRIQQVAKPQELYKNPANVFVADFIGTPSMNFIDCTVTHDGQEVRLESDAFSILISEEYDAARSVMSATSTGDDCVLGIRPQHLSIVRDESIDRELATTLSVVIVETAGEEYIIHLESGDTRVKSVVEEGLQIKRGDTVAVEIDPDAIHLFDPDSGDALLPDSENRATASPGAVNR
jgi:ABC-type sugar transport systems, ATPase components